MNSWVKAPKTTAAQCPIWTSKTTTWYYKAWPSNWALAWATRSQCQTSRLVSNYPSKSFNLASNYKVAQWTLTRATCISKRKTTIPRTQASVTVTKPHSNNNRLSTTLMRTNTCSIALQSASCSKTKYEMRLPGIHGSKDNMTQHNDKLERHNIYTKYKYETKDQ